MNVLVKNRFNKLFITLNINDIMSLANNGEYIGNCKFCKDHLSLDYISSFKTSHETDFYFCSLGHYWTVKDTSEQSQIITNSKTVDLTKGESYQDKPFNTDKPLNRDKPFNRDRDRPPFNRDRDKPFNRDRDKPFNRDRDKPFNRDRDKPFNRDRDRPPFNRDRDRPPFNRDRDRPPFNRDRDRPPFNRDRPPFNRDRPPFNRDRPPFNRDRDKPFNTEKKEGFYKQFSSNKKGKRKRE
jgi:hypothetical protein